MNTPTKWWMRVYLVVLAWLTAIEKDDRAAELDWLYERKAMLQAQRLHIDNEIMKRLHP